jgi:protoheme IX farnesyltransferase
VKASASPLAAAGAVERSAFSIFCELVKARLTFLVVLTTLVGFYLGARGAVDYWLMFHAVCGTSLLACGAAALNQLAEREHDARMRRTETRPLPSGRMQPQSVLLIGGFLCAAGMLYLSLWVNLLTALIGVLTLGSYLFVYTPLKRVTWLNTAVGAIPGALPPVMGWTAAQNDISGGTWALFCILFFWQIPHFLAIAWLYRDDYAKAGFVMLPNVDPDGSRTGRQAVSHTLGLLLVSLAPFRYQLTGPIYLLGALVLGLGFLGAAILFARRLDRAAARRLFFVSILYLPLLLGVMVFDKLKH